MLPDGNQTPNSGMCPDREPNWQPFGVREDAHPTEPLLPGQIQVLIWKLILNKNSEKNNIVNEKDTGNLSTIEWYMFYSKQISKFALTTNKKCYVQHKCIYPTTI